MQHQFANLQLTKMLVEQAGRPADLCPELAWLERGHEPCAHQVRNQTVVRVAVATEHQPPGLAAGDAATDGAEGCHHGSSVVVEVVVEEVDRLL
jgi:hypothetical protein